MSEICPDCGVEEGQLNKPGCAQERCPFCGGQLISCDCVYTALGYHKNYEKPYNGLPKRVYEKGLNDEESHKWTYIINRKGRIPYIYYPIICAKCGHVNPKMFYVSDNVWEKYIQIEMRLEVICQDCFEKIKDLIDKADPSHALSCIMI